MFSKAFLSAVPVLCLAQISAAAQAKSLFDDSEGIYAPSAVTAGSSAFNELSTDMNDMEGVFARHMRETEKPKVTLPRKANWGNRFHEMIKASEGNLDKLVKLLKEDVRRNSANWKKTAKALNEFEKETTLASSTPDFSSLLSTSQNSDLKTSSLSTSSMKPSDPFLDLNDDAASYQLSDSVGSFLERRQKKDDPAVALGKESVNRMAQSLEKSKRNVEIQRQVIEAKKHDVGNSEGKMEESSGVTIKDFDDLVKRQKENRTAKTFNSQSSFAEMQQTSTQTKTQTKAELTSEALSKSSSLLVAKSKTEAEMMKDPLIAQAEAKFKASQQKTRKALEELQKDLVNLDEEKPASTGDISMAETDSAEDAELASSFLQKSEVDDNKVKQWISKMQKALLEETRKRQDSEASARKSKAAGAGSGASFLELDRQTSESSLGNDEQRALSQDAAATEVDKRSKVDKWIEMMNLELNKMKENQREISRKNRNTKRSKTGRVSSNKPVSFLQLENSASASAGSSSLAAALESAESATAMAEREYHHNVERSKKIVDSIQRNILDMSNNLRRIDDKTSQEAKILKEGRMRQSAIVQDTIAELKRIVASKMPSTPSLPALGRSLLQEGSGASVTVHPIDEKLLEPLERTSAEALEFAKRIKREGEEFRAEYAEKLHIPLKSLETDFFSLPKDSEMKASHAQSSMLETAARKSQVDGEEDDPSDLVMRGIKAAERELTKLGKSVEEQKADLYKQKKFYEHEFNRPIHVAAMETSASNDFSDRSGGLSFLEVDKWAPHTSRHKRPGSSSARSLYSTPELDAAWALYEKQLQGFEARKKSRTRISFANARSGSSSLLQTTAASEAQSIGDKSKRIVAAQRRYQNSIKKLREDSKIMEAQIEAADRRYEEATEGLEKAKKKYRELKNKPLFE